MDTIYLLALASLGFMTWLTLDWYKEVHRAQMIKARAARYHVRQVRISNLPR